MSLHRELAPWPWSASTDHTDIDPALLPTLEPATPPEIIGGVGGLDVDERARLASSRGQPGLQLIARGPRAGEPSADPHPDLADAEALVGGALVEG